VSGDARDEDGSPDPGETAYLDARGQGGPDLPAIDFTTLILSLSHSALLHLGDAPDPASGELAVSLPMARQSIDLIAMLQEKTRGNLSGDEERMLSQALYDLRMRYVEVTKSR
jgi:hypothetical protein